ncbi:MAG: hypothetical protein ACK2UH_00615, partial [Candidatus Promineifilaceae bacterium]
VLCVEADPVARLEAVGESAETDTALIAAAREALAQQGGRPGAELFDCRGPNLRRAALNALDELDAQLTASFDLTDLPQANLNFWTWYDLEDGYDFAYVSASSDGGTTWDVLMPASAQAGEYGPALSGRSTAVDGNSGGWIEETVSLAAFAGENVLIRFEVLSDSAIAETGFAVDDIAIPELGYFDNVENDASAWQARGFVRTGPQVPQIWRLNLVVPDPSPQVVALDLDNGSRGNWTVDLGEQGGTLIIIAQTPFVSDPTSYWLAVDPQD